MENRIEKKSVFGLKITVLMIMILSTFAHASTSSSYKISTEVLNSTEEQGFQPVTKCLEAAVT